MTTNHGRRDAIETRLIYIDRLIIHLFPSSLARLHGDSFYETNTTICRNTASTTLLGLAFPDPEAPTQLTDQNNQRAGANATQVFPHFLPDSRYFLVKKTYRHEMLSYQLVVVSALFWWYAAILGSALTRSIKEESKGYSSTMVVGMPSRLPSFSHTSLATTAMSPMDS